MSRVNTKHRLRSANNFTIVELKSECEKVGYSLTESAEVPALVSVINSSRPVADIRRDLGRCKGGFTAVFFHAVLTIFFRGSPGDHAGDLQTVHTCQ